MPRYRSPRASLLACLVVLAVYGAACADDGADSAPPPATTDAAAPAPAAPAPAPAPAGGQTVSVNITPDSLEVSTLEVAAGPVSIQASNATPYPFDVDIEGAGVDQDIDDLQPGATGSVTLDLAAGSYRIEVDEDGDRPDAEERRHQVTLTVR